jgi:cytochrome b6-f complex subunit 4
MANENDKKSLYPDYLPYVAAALLVAVEAILAAALLFPPRIGQSIDMAAPYQPKPEWYFLWIYQLLRYFPGRYAIFGTVIIPMLLIFVFIFMPYIDRGKNGRSKAVIAAVALFALLAVLTLIPALFAS